MKIFTPLNINELFEIKAKYQNALILAGGTDLLAQWHNNKSRPDIVISLSQVKNLSFIRKEEQFIEIGSLTNHSILSSEKIIKSYLPVLSFAASTIGAPAIRNMGTIGGNIANASPAADLPPALLIYDSSLIIASQSGKRELKLSEFYRGYKMTALSPEEIIYSFRVPLPPADIYAEFFKIGTRKAQSIAKVSL
ncbi:MAG: FAD binding domain-containing protein, partial [Deltaproteobacteria bacterium]|nr:FAD binding domain-containing protein [Deltaproteobacteria bacterium]